MDGTQGTGRRRSGSPRLFEPEELRLNRTGQARLRDLARIPRRRLSGGEARAEEERAVMERLRARGAHLASHFGLSCACIEAEQEGVYDHYGLCYQDGVIRVRLRHAVTGRLLKESSLVDTLCHELAHLRYFDHGSRFKGLYMKILDEARQLGYYRPGPISGSGPTQASLLEVCGMGEVGSGDGG